MSRQLDAIRKTLNGTPIRAAGEGMGLVVVVTDDELITAKARLFGTTIERFKLATVEAVRLVPNPTTNLLTIEFAGSPARSLTVMYGADELAAFGELIAVVGGRARGGRGLT